MKNIQVIDGALNCVFDIFACTDEDFIVIFPEGTDIAFIDEVHARNAANREVLTDIFLRLWKNRIKKPEVQGVHGTLFYELAYRKAMYPTRRDEEAIVEGIKKGKA